MDIGWILHGTSRQQQQARDDDGEENRVKTSGDAIGSVRKDQAHIDCTGTWYRIQDVQTAAKPLVPEIFDMNGDELSHAMKRYAHNQLRV